MIAGVVSADREATITLGIGGVNAPPVAVTAVIDTGFTGDLTLPPALITSLGLARIGARRATLADGSRVNLEVYEATILWDGQALDVLSLAADGEPLVGMSLLYGHTLTVQVVDGGDVSIEALP